MRSSNNIKYSNISLEYKAWLSSQNGKGIFGDGRWNLLKAIDEKGSLKAATKIIGINYRKAWEDLRKAEALFGFALIEKHRGGQKGGSTILTEEKKN